LRMCETRFQTWTFVQERVTGMKIVQLFHREDIEAEKFKKHQR
jgi:hypothetical protein